MDYNVLVDLDNKTEEYAFDSVAKQANGSVWLKSGKSILLATVVIDEHEFAGGEFLPLTVQYVEKAYAAGKFPGGYIKRESKASDFEALTSRLIDRSLRPLFPKGFTNPVQITIIVLSADEESDLQALALNAASSALYISDIDIKSSVTACRVAKVDGKVVINPSVSQLAESTLDLFVAGSKDDLLMIEMKVNGSVEVELLSTAMVDPMIDPAMGVDTIERYSSNILAEEEFISILTTAQKVLKNSNAMYEKAFDLFVKEPIALELHSVEGTDVIEEEITQKYSIKINEAINHMAKSERSNALRTIRLEILEKHREWDKEHVKLALQNVKTKMVRAMILHNSVRADGRGLDEIRPIDIKTNVLPSAHASCLFTRGQTQALVVLTLGDEKDAQQFETLTESGQQSERFMVHYNFPGFSVGEASPMSAPKRRELGHGNLAKRALECTLESPANTIRLVSEILESNGSSSMATVCGGYMAMRAADLELTDTVAGIAMGMVSEGDDYAILSDITGLEDHDGDLDFKVTGSKEGISALQMDIKLGGIALEVLQKALYQAREGRVHIIDIMLEAEEKIRLSDDLPTHDIFDIDPARVGEIIGQAGKTIREIIEKFEVAIDIDRKGGKVKVSGTNREGIQGAKEHIVNIATKERAPRIEYEVGDVIDGTVKRIVDFGAFIELPGTVDGLLHISKISDEHVKNVADVISIGDTIKVEILEFKGSKISLGRAKS